MSAPSYLSPATARGGGTIPDAEGRNRLALLLAFRRDQIGFLNRVVRRDPDIVRLAFPGLPVVMLNRPDYVQHVLVDNHENYDKDNRLFRVVRPILRNGLIGAVGGESWHRQRRLMQPSFHRPKTAAFVGNMVDETDAMIGRWHDAHGPGDVVNLFPDVGHLALRIVSRTLFGADVGPSTDAVEDAFDKGNRILGRYFRLPLLPLSVPTPAHRKLFALIAFADEYVDGLIEQRRARGGEHHDLLGILAEAVDEESGYRMSPRQLREEVANIMIGGYETTTTAVCWLLYHVARNQEIQERMQNEIDRVLGGRAPDFADFTALPYTRMVVDETLRLTTPAWQTMRGTIGDDEIDGYPIPAGTDIYVNFFTMHRHPEFWPDPERFDPERFSPAQAAERPRNAYAPFGSGPRICIGKHFALAELMVITVMLLQAYRMRLAAGPQVRPNPLITLRPKPDVRVHLDRR